MNVTILNICLLVETLLIIILAFRLNVFKKSFIQLTGYLAAIMNNSDIMKESLTTIALYYGIEYDDLVKLLERNKK